MSEVLALGLLVAGLALLFHHNRLPPSLLLALFLFSAPAAVGCANPNTTARHALHVTAVAVDETVPLLADTMKQEGLAEIRRAESRSDALVRVERVKAEWEPVWMSLDIFQRLHGAAADLVERGETLSLRHLAEVVKAYCHARGLLAPHGHKLPDVPVIGCTK